VSSAPLASLRTFWALGGAPAACVQRDERLRLACERMLRQEDVGAALASERAWATLVSGVDLSAALPLAEEGRPRMQESIAHGGRYDRRSASRVALPESRILPRDASSWRERTPSAPVGDGVEDPHDAIERAESRASDAAGERERATGRPLDVDPRGCVAVPPAAPDVDEGGVRGRDEARTTSVGATRGATGPAALARPVWHHVSPVRRESNREISARVAVLLTEDAEYLTSKTIPISPRPRAAGDNDSGPPADTPTPHKSIGELLGKVVRRVEQRVAEAPRVAAATSTGSPTATRSGRACVDYPAVGLRGLADRAPFFGDAGRSHDGLWPDTELDRFASLIDDAARQDGVAPEEEIA
jgi:hypothetical protein